MDVGAFAAGAVLGGFGALRFARGHDAVSRAICVAVFASSAVVFELVVCETLMIGNQTLRAHLWWLLINLLLVLLGFVVPAVEIASRIGLGRGRLALVGLAYLIYLFSFYFVSQKLPLDDAADLHWIHMRQRLLAGISCAGITIMAGLCGVSSISAPYASFLWQPKSVTESDLSRMAESIETTKQLMATKELQANRLKLDIKNRTRKSSTNLLGKMLSSWRPDELTSELADLNVEVATLDRLQGEMIIDRENAARRLEQQHFGATLAGRLHAAAYAVFAAYCIYRVFQSYRRMGWWLLNYQSANGPGPRDALVVLLASQASKLQPRLSTDSWVRVIATFMSAAVFGTALNGMLRTLGKVFKHRRLAMDPLVVAHFVGIYILAIVTVLRLNVPKELSAPILSALKSPLKVEFLQLWNDVVLCTASTIMIGVLFVTSRLRDSEVDEKYD